jgi:hypothetical protein
MAGLQHSGKLGRLFTTPMKRSDDAVLAVAQAENGVVRLLDCPSQPTGSPVQQRLLAALNRSGAASVSSLVHAIAQDLYIEELRMGAGVLDIGLFGSRLFHNDVIQELWAGDGRLWQIGKERDGTT